MLAVANTEHLMQMQKYVRDPDKEPKPDLRIQSLKEYKEILESLQKIVTGSGNNKNSLLDKLSNTTEAVQQIAPSYKDSDDDAATLMAEVLDD
jgi:hypothetical protein